MTAGEINLSVEVERPPCDRPRNKALASWRDAGFLKAVAGSYAQVGAVRAMMEACGMAPGAAVQRREPSVEAVGPRTEIRSASARSAVRRCKQLPTLWRLR